MTIFWALASIARFNASVTRINSCDSSLTLVSSAFSSSLVACSALACSNFLFVSANSSCTTVIWPSKSAFSSAFASSIFLDNWLISSVNLAISLASAFPSTNCCSFSALSFRASISLLFALLVAVIASILVCKADFASSIAAFMFSALTGLFDVILSICSCRFLTSSS